MADALGTHSTDWPKDFMVPLGAHGDGDGVRDRAHTGSPELSLPLQPFPGHVLGACALRVPYRTRLEVLSMEPAGEETEDVAPRVTIQA